MIAEKENQKEEITDPEMKKLILTCKNLQEYLLNYANFKPTRKHI